MKDTMNAKRKGPFSDLEKSLIKGSILQMESPSDIATYLNRSLEAVSNYIDSLDIPKMFDDYKNNVNNTMKSNGKFHLDLPSNVGILKKQNRDSTVNWIREPSIYDYKQNPIL